MASAYRVPFGVLHRPVGVRAVQIAVFVYHFRLKPQAEVEPRFAYAFGKALYAAGKLFCVDAVIAQARAVVVSVAEPAVVEHKQFYAQL